MSQNNEQVMRMALLALEPGAMPHPEHESLTACAIAGLKEALAAQAASLSKTDECGEQAGLSLNRDPQTAQAGQSEPVVWRYQDARGHYRFRAYVPNFDAEYAILKPVPLYTHPAPVRQPLTGRDEAWRKACMEIIDRCVEPDMYDNARSMLNKAFHAAKINENKP